jgi:FAS-associated factor 2
MGLIANIPSPTSSSPIQMALLSRIEGLVTPAQLIATLTTAINRTRPTINRQRALKEEQRSTRELRRMQEEAYSNSLAQDRAREAEQRRREEEEAQKEREREDQARKAEIRQKQREQWRFWKSNDLKKAGLVGMKSEIGKTARVGLRLAGGERIVQMFPGDIALAEVYAFVECYDLLFLQSSSELTLRTASDPKELEEVEKPEDYEHYFKFRLVVPYPRKVIDSGLTLVKEESALWPSGSIVVEEIDEDDTEDEDSDEEV